MNKFYNYDTRGASESSQIINLERMVQERDSKIEQLTITQLELGKTIDKQNTEIDRLRYLLQEQLDCQGPEIEQLQQMIKDAAEALNTEELENERLRGFISWILDAYDNDEWPAQKDIVTGAREVLGAVDH